MAIIISQLYMARNENNGWRNVNNESQWQWPMKTMAAVANVA
jgi:hypothetical protein